MPQFRIPFPPDSTAFILNINSITFDWNCANEECETEKRRESWSKVSSGLWLPVVGLIAHLPPSGIPAELSRLRGDSLLHQTSPKLILKDNLINWPPVWNFNFRCRNGNLFSIETFLSTRGKKIRTQFFHESYQKSHISAVCFNYELFMMLICEANENKNFIMCTCGKLLMLQRKFIMLSRTKFKVEIRWKLRAQSEIENLGRIKLEANVRLVEAC